MKLAAPVPEPTAPCCVAAGRLCDQHVAGLTRDQQRALYAARRRAAASPEKLRTPREERTS